MGRKVQCPAGEWTAVFNHAFVQLPHEWTVTFSTVEGGTVEGEVEIQRSSWIFPNQPETQPLEATMTFQRGWWNTFFKVSVKPTRTVVAQIR
jgi:hypothetical protein